MMDFINTTLSSVTQALINLEKDSKDYEHELIKLKRLYLLECRTNLKILDISKNTKIELDDAFKLLKHLHNESSYVLYIQADQSLLKSIFKKVKKNNDLDPIKNDELLISIISKIELLKLLASNFEYLESQSVIRIRARINNLYVQLKEVVKTFNDDIN